MQKKRQEQEKLQQKQKAINKSQNPDYVSREQVWGIAQQISDTVPLSPIPGEEQKGEGQEKLTYRKLLHQVLFEGKAAAFWHRLVEGSTWKEKIHDEVWT
jgi:hypothetical protein